MAYTESLPVLTENAVIQGDCVEVMAGLDAESVDAIVTDPPYGLGFMGKAWDHGVPGVAFWREMFRVAKPSSYLLAFGGTRTVHRIATSIEDAGWIIRDMLVWAYASGFPKSKASLKPAWEPIVMARKPGPLRMLAIDECRIPMVTVEGAGLDVNTHLRPNVRRTPGDPTSYQPHKGESRYEIPLGRWPANVILTDPIFDGGVESVVGGGAAASGGNINGRPVTGYGGHWADSREFDGYSDSGTYSRFFLIPKADRADREPVLGGLAETTALRTTSVLQVHCAKCGKQKVNVPGAACSCPEPEWIKGQSQRARANSHPTVKPTELMRHLVRLVTPTGGLVPPTGGLVLDPFLGSGTTAIAAELEGFRWLGIEKEPEYVAIAEARLNGTQRGLGLDVPAPVEKHGHPPHVGPGTPWVQWIGQKADEDPPA